jgi:lysophospholipase L1-like esterase
MSKTKIGAFGDAVTAGTSAKLDVFHDCFQNGTTTVNMVRETQTWCSIMARIMSDWIEDGVELINAGRSVDTSSKGLARMERDVLSNAPDYVLVQFGAEDALAGMEPAAFRANLEKIVSGIAARNANPILMTPTPISERMTASGWTLCEVRRRQDRLSALAQVVRMLADKKSLDLIDLHRYFLDTRLAYDHLFEGRLPDAVAQSGMASFIAGALLPLLGVKDFPTPILCDTRKVYSDPERPDVMHHAFTDLAFFKGEFFLTFRKGPGHGLPTASNVESEVIVVLRSRDGIVWSEEAVLKVEGLDNRDPKFLHADGRLRVYTFCCQIPPDSPNTVTYGFERVGPGKWSPPFRCAPGAFWRPKKWRGQYVVSNQDIPIKLLCSPDGRTWKEHSAICEAASGANETDLCVEGDQLTAFSRSDPKEGPHTMLVSRFIEPENRWETVSSGRIIQAPCVFKVGGRFFVSGRTCAYPHEEFTELGKEFGKFGRGEPGAEEVDLEQVEKYHHGLRTGIFVMDGTRARQVAELLSAGDSSYTGVVQYGDETILSDYSMHEYYPEIRCPGDWNTPCDIYVSRIRFGG